MEDHVSGISNNIKSYFQMWKNETIPHSILVTIILLVVFGLTVGTFYLGVAKLFSSSQPVSTLPNEQKVSNSPQDLKNVSHENESLVIQNKTNETIITKDPVIVKELHDKNLFDELVRANNGLSGKNDTYTRLTIYKNVLNQLSPEALKRLDKALLNSANNDYFPAPLSAVEKYKQLFSK